MKGEGRREKGMEGGRKNKREKERKRERKDRVLIEHRIESKAVRQLNVSHKQPSSFANRKTENWLSHFPEIRIARSTHKMRSL